MGKKKAKVAGKENPGRQEIDIFKKGYLYQRVHADYAAVTDSYYLLA